MTDEKKGDGMTLEQALQIMNKVCGYAFNKAYGANVAMKVIKTHLSRQVSVTDEDVAKAWLIFDGQFYADRRGIESMRRMRAVLEADRAGRGVDVPDEMDAFATQPEGLNYADGWNACREAMLAKTQPGAEGNGNG